jgi:hypothetical protein
MDQLVIAALAVNALATVGVLLLEWRNSRNIQTIHLATNSMREELVRVTASDSFQKGEAHERAQPRP